MNYGRNNFYETGPSFLRKVVNYGQKKIYKIGPWSREFFGTAGIWSKSELNGLSDRRSAEKKLDRFIVVNNKRGVSRTG